MKLPSRHHGGGLKFNLTPMIDIVFNLIIFFLAASHMARSEITADVELPRKATGGPEEADLNRRLIVTVLDNGTLNVGGQEMALPQVNQLMADGRGSHETTGNFEVRIRTDRRAPLPVYGAASAQLRRAGITNVRFSVLPSQ